MEHVEDGLSPGVSQRLQAAVNDGDVSSTNSFAVVTPKIFNCYSKACRRRPRGVSVFMVFLIYFSESFAFYSVLNGTLKKLIPDYNYFWLNLICNSAGRVCYPIFGLFADSYFGRHNIVHVGLLFLWFGSAFNSLSISIDSYAQLEYIPLKVATETVLPALVLLLFVAGSGSVEATMVTFGVDQLAQGASSDELSAYFYWYYFVRNSGVMASILVIIALYDPHIRFCPQACHGEELELVNRRTMDTGHSLVIVIVISFALMLHHCQRDVYYHDRKHPNPVKQIVNVLYFAARVKRHQPMYRRAFRYSEGKKSRIELAKIEYDGIFPSEEVEDVKTFYRMFFYFLSLSLYFATYQAVSHMMDIVPLVIICMYISLHVVFVCVCILT